VDPNRRIAITAGVLFVTATVASLASTALTNPILTASDYLSKVNSNQNEMVLGALLQFLASVASAGIAISLYPVLKRYDEGLALGSVGLRLIEAVFGIVVAVGLLTLVTVGQDFASAGSSNAVYYQNMGSVIKAQNNWAGFVFLALAFTLGALIYYYIFYRSRLIPRWLSGWGFIAAAMSLSAAILVAFGNAPLSTTTILLNVPIAVQEMVLAAWLIVKGFDRVALDSLSAKSASRVGVT